MSYEIKRPRSDAYCSFCRANSNRDERHFMVDREFRDVSHSSNEYQFYTFTICEACARRLAADLLAEFR